MLDVGGNSSALPVQHAGIEQVHGSIGMRPRGKKRKAKRRARTSFGELVQRLWEPEPTEPKQRATNAKLKKPTAKSNRTRKR
jgi:hypothetical protein